MRESNGFSLVIILCVGSGALDERASVIGVRQKSVTDTDSGMQQEHSRKSMFSAEEGGKENHYCAFLSFRRHGAAPFGGNW